MVEILYRGLDCRPLQDRRRVVDKEPTDPKGHDESPVEAGVSAPERAFREGQHQDLPVPIPDQDAGSLQVLSFPLNSNEPTPMVTATRVGMEDYQRPFEPRPLRRSGGKSHGFQRHPQFCGQFI